MVLLDLWFCNFRAQRLSDIWIIRSQGAIVDTASLSFYNPKILKCIDIGGTQTELKQLRSSYVAPGCETRGHIDAECPGK